jgi:thiol-disulfide isomerase/thioredoxin
MKTGLEGKLMPDIDLILVDTNSHFNTANIALGKPTVLFSFEPWCPYCKAQTKALISKIESLKDVNICFLTNSTYPGFKEFYDRFHLEKYPNVKAGIDYKYGFARYFQTNQIPFLAIYDRSKKLKQVLIGRNYFSTIKEAVTE